MNELDIESLQVAVEGLHDCKAFYKETVQVSESFEGQKVWEGDVYIFELEDHPTAKLAYAWWSLLTESDNRKYYAVLHHEPIQSAQDAVRASIVSDYKEATDD